jgi:PBP1b-binding outer membrane lipoprotein LpoB
MSINPQYQELPPTSKPPMMAYFVVAGTIIVLALLLGGCTTDSAGNTHFDAETAAKVLDTGERMYRDYERQQHPEFRNQPVVILPP